MRKTALLAIFLSGAFVYGDSFDFYRMDGSFFSGSLDLLSADAIRVRAQNKNIVPPIENAVLVELRDGSRIVKQHIIDVDVAHIVSIRFSADEPEPEWKRLQQSQNVYSDRLVLLSLDFYEGIIEKIAEDSVFFRMDNETLQIKRSKIYGVIFRHSEKRYAKTVAKLTEISGSVYLLSEFSVDKNQINWKTVSGLSGKTQRENLLELDFSQERFLPLSEMTPESYERTGISADVFTAFFKNLAGKTQTLSLPAKTSVNYTLAENVDEFRATIGISEKIQPSGKLRFTIHGDKRLLLDKIVSGDESPFPISVNVAGVKTFTLTVDFVDEPISGCVLTIADPKFILVAADY